MSCLCWCVDQTNRIQEIWFLLSLEHSTEDRRNYAVLTSIVGGGIISYASVSSSCSSGASRPEVDRKDDSLLLHIQQRHIILYRKWWWLLRLAIDLIREECQVHAPHHFNFCCHRTKALCCFWDLFYLFSSMKSSPSTFCVVLWIYVW